MDVDRLDRIAAGRVQDVVHLREPQEIAKILLVAGAPAAVEVGAIGRRRHLRDDQIVAAEADIVRRVARMDREFRRRVRDQLEDHVGVEAHPLAALADIGAVILHDLAGAVMQHVDADLLQHAQRGEVDRFELVVGDQLGRGQRNLELPERRLLEGGRAAGAFSGPAAAPRAFRRDHRFGWMQCGGHGIPREVVCRRHNGPRPIPSVRMRRPLGRGKRHEPEAACDPLVQL